MSKKSKAEAQSKLNDKALLDFFHSTRCEWGDKSFIGKFFPIYDPSKPIEFNLPKAHITK